MLTLLCRLFFWLSLRLFSERRRTPPSGTGTQTPNPNPERPGIAGNLGPWAWAGLRRNSASQFTRNKFRHETSYNAAGCSRRQFRTP
ncbi:hypothetical protein C8F01DRAFT_1106448 [Mycena amicta]|nr:hypothetical protein C8F01DRAFT_1106448 [Mycena amicta]